MRRLNKTNTKILIILILFISIGFAYLTRDLSLSGISSIFRNTWDIHFENVQVKSGSVEANKPVIDENQTSVSFYAELNEPGDYYEFTVDAVNEGTIDAMIDTFSSIEIDEEFAPLVEYTITYEDGEALAQYQELNAGDSCVYKIRLYYKLDINEEDLPDEAISLDLTFTVDYIQADSNRIRRRAENTLYNVLKNEAESGGLAKKYTGAHQDSMDASLSTKDIYHWYATNDTDGTAVTNKNNVIFANHCWQLIRTTDTGGAKLIYNGEVENNQCLNTRGNHVGYSKVVTTSLSDTYYYGTDYTYNEVAKKFSLSGNITTGEIKLGQYTCKSTNTDGTCTTLYLVDELYSGTKYEVIPLKETANYSQFGALQYNVQSKVTGSIVAINYMFKNRRYLTGIGGGGRGVYSTTTLNANSTYYYADSVSYSSSQYTLENPSSGIYSDISSSLIGKYICIAENSSTCNNTLYVVYVNSQTVAGLELYNGKTLNDIDAVMYFGTGYIDNHDGTYALTNTTSIKKSEWVNSYSSINSDYYFCTDNDLGITCSSGIERVASTNVFGTQDVGMSNDKIYANSYTYDGNTNKYKLDSINRVQFWDTIDPNNRALWNSNHYYCDTYGATDECSTLNYILYTTNDYLPTFVPLENGESLQDFLNDMLYAEDINTYDSTLKIGIDAWYKKYLLNYGSKIEDTIYCSDRTISDYGAWNPNGGVVGSKLVFGTIGSSNLSCPNELDSFSTNNSKAKLTYPVGLLTYQEVNLLNNNNIRANNGVYWLSNPNGSEGTNTYNRVVGSTGKINTISYTTSANGVRPAISLKSTTTYSSGDGTMESPYVIDTN